MAFSIAAKGISGHLMKASAKRRRSRQQIKDDKLKEEWEKAETARKIQKLEQLEQENAQLQQKVQASSQMEQQVQGFIDQGLLVMDDQGVPQLNAEAVLESERQSQASAQRQQEPEMIPTNRRQAQVFGMNKLELDPDSF